MLQFKEIKHKRLCFDDQINWTFARLNSKKRRGVSHPLYVVLNMIFDISEDNEFWQKFLDEYEFIYDKKREYLMLIVRNVRIRVRKYFYMPPIYVVFELKNNKAISIEQQKLRYLQKLQFYSVALSESEERAYYLNENPYQIAYHPHIDGRAYACLGSWGENLVYAKENGPHAYMETLRGFLNDYNGRSPFFRIDPYAFDRKQNDHVQFPFRSGTLIQHGLPTYANKTDYFLRKYLGDDWLLKMCETMELNYELWNSLWFYFLAQPIDDPFENYAQIVINTLKECDIECPYNEPHLFPYSEAELTQDEFDEKRKLYHDFMEWFKLYDSNNIQTMIYAYIYKLLKVELSFGDLEVYSKSLANYKINYEHNEDKYKEIYEAERTIGYTYVQALTLSEDPDETYYGNMKLIHLLNIVVSRNLTSVKTNYYNWIIAMSRKLPRVLWNAEYLKLRNSQHTDYTRLRDEEIYNDNISLEFESGENIYIGGETYHWGSKFPLLSMYKRILYVIQQEYRRKGRGEGTLIEYKDVKTFQDNIFKNINWEKKYKKAELKKKDLFKKAVKGLFKYGIGFKDRELRLLEEMIKEYINNDQYTDIDDVDWLMNAMQQGKIREEANLNVLKDIIYTLFPHLPKTINEVPEIIYQIDKRVLVSAYRYKIDSYNNLIKEYSNVLKNTVPSVQQGELFPEEISFN